MKILICIILASALWGGESFATASKSRNRIQELFIWKVSDKLELNADVETKFADIVKKLNQEKTQLSEEIDLQVQKMESEKDEAKLQALVKSFEVSQKKMNDLQDREVAELKKLLGVKKFARYLVIKRDITNRLKEMLSRSEQDGGDKHMGEPKVIEEK